MKFLDLRSFQKVALWSTGVGKLAALDVGTKHVGLALTDESRRFVIRGDTLKRKSGRGEHRLASSSVEFLTRQLQAFIAKEKVRGLVVGIPLHNEKPTPFCQEIVDLMLRMDCFLPDPVSLPSVDTSAMPPRTSPEHMPFTLWDEYGSTVEGRRLVKQTSTKRSVYLKQKDSIAASVILQEFLLHSEEEYARDTTTID